MIYNILTVKYLTPTISIINLFKTNGNWKYLYFTTTEIQIIWSLSNHYISDTDKPFRSFGLNVWRNSSNVPVNPQAYVWWRTICYWIPLSWCRFSPELRCPVCLVGNGESCVVFVSNICVCFIRKWRVVW